MIKTRIIHLLLFLLVCTTNGFSQVNDSNYQYPVVPGTEKWKSFTTHQQMLDACQIPMNTIDKLNTEGLVETCLKYPLYMDLYAYNNLQDGFNAVTNNFNGLKALLERKDAFNIISKKYKSLDIGLVGNNLYLQEQESYSFKIMNISILLAQYDILQNGNTRDLIELLRLATINYNKQTNKAIFGYLTHQVNAFLISRILNSLDIYDQYLNYEIKSFLEFGTEVDPKAFDEILSLSTNYLKSLN